MKLRKGARYGPELATWTKIDNLYGNCTFAVDGRDHAEGCMR